MRPGRRSRPPYSIAVSLFDIHSSRFTVRADLRFRGAITGRGGRSEERVMTSVQDRDLAEGTAPASEPRARTAPGFKRVLVAVADASQAGGVADLARLAGASEAR